MGETPRMPVDIKAKTYLYFHDIAEDLNESAEDLICGVLEDFASDTKPAKSFPDWRPGEEFYDDSTDAWQAEFGDTQFLVEQACYIPLESEKPATVPTFFDTMTPNDAQLHEIQVLRFAEIPEGENR